jgi:Protein O-mannosyl-transferase TMEM260-like
VRETQITRQPYATSTSAPATRPQIALRTRTALAAGLVFGLSGLVYWLTLSRTINSFDSAELITGAYSLGIIHAPGYPLYLLIAHLATRLPWGDIPLNVNLLSAIFSSLAATVIFFASWRLTRSIWSSVLAALLLAFSRLFWSQAVIAEVYALNAFLIACIVLMAIIWYEQPSRRNLIGLAFIAGLSLVHHPSSMLLLPGLVVLVLLRASEARLTWRKVWPVLPAMILPLLLYLYLPLRSAAGPPLDYVGDYFNVNLASIEGLLWMVSGQMFAEELFGRPILEGLSQFVFLGRQLWLNLVGGGLVLAMYGLVSLRRRIGLAFFLGGGAALIIIFFAFYDVVDSALMIHPALVLLAPPLALGTDRFVTKVLRPAVLRSTTQIWLLALLMVVSVSLVISANWRFADRSEDYSAYKFAQEVMEIVEPNALVLAQWTSATPLEYAQIVEGRRPDVEILDRGLLGLAVRDQLKREGIATSDEYGPFAVAVLTERVREELNERPVYIMEDDPIFRDSFCLERLEQGIFRILPQDESGPDC